QIFAAGTSPWSRFRCSQGQGFAVIKVSFAVVKVKVSPVKISPWSRLKFSRVQSQGFAMFRAKVLPCSEPRFRRD
ncbi:14881_t:CDS:1, partial [Dentiscutata heterogama]